VEVVREFSYPSVLEPDKHSPTGWSPEKFAIKDLGVTFKASCKIETKGGLKGSISLDLDAEVSDFLGFLNEKDGAKRVARSPVIQPGSIRPIFSEAGGDIQLSLLPNQTVLLRIPPNVHETGSATLTVNRILLVTVNIVPPDKSSPAASPFTDPTPTSALIRNPSLPDAIPVNGKPGFVTSPYASPPRF
jgi:hypothetical protein